MHTLIAATFIACLIIGRTGYAAMLFIVLLILPDGKNDG
jgi:hypothetical protein